jgi:YbbR domain-containing protein
LNIPTGIKVLEGNAVLVQLAIDNYTTKTLSYAVSGLDDVTVENMPSDKKLSLQSQVLSDIVLCGNAATLRRITAKDLKLTLDASDSTATGSVRYVVRITVPNYNNVWVYYGKDDASAYRLYGTVE